MTRISEALRIVDRRWATTKLVLPLHQLVKRLLNLQFGTGIDAGGRLVEDQHRRQAEHDTGDTKKLFLPLADAVFAENRVKPLRQTLDKLPAVCLFGRIDDLLFRRIRLSGS